MNKQNDIKAEQLGMPIGTASNILRKSIMFDLLKRHGENVCFQCGEEIESVDNLSIEHKTPWLYSENPKELFFSLDNIAFSHIKCNISAHRYTQERAKLVHGTTTGYLKNGCRCEECVTVYREWNRIRMRKVRHPDMV
jgi:hypothetical protein